MDQMRFTSLAWTARLIEKRLRDAQKQKIEDARQRETAERNRGRPLDGPQESRKPKIMRRKL